MDLLPPKEELRLERVRTFRLGRDGFLRLLAELRKERATGRVVVHLSQGAPGDVEVRETQKLPREGEEP